MQRRIMRVHSLLAACSVVGACVLFAPSARADSFFVTFTNGTAPVGSRVQGATFEATSVATPSGPRPYPVKIEIDDWSIFQPTLVTITKTPGAATQAFQTAATTGKIIDPMAITFVQHHGTQPDTISKTVVLSKAYVATAGLQAGAPAVEKVTVLPTTVLKLTAGTTTTEVAATPQQHH